MKRLRCLILALHDWLTNAPTFWREPGDPRPPFGEYLAEREANQRAIAAYEAWQRDPNTVRPFEELEQDLIDDRQNDPAQPPQGQ